MATLSRFIRGSYRVNEINESEKSPEEVRGKTNGSVQQDPIVQRIARFLEDARRELIDISRRNRLLHSPRSNNGAAGPESAHTTGGSGGRPRFWRSHCLEFLNVDLDSVFGSLREGHIFGFDAERREDESLDHRARGRVAQRFQTQLAPDALEKRLLRCFREARIIE